jgi:hypothetical protein
MTVWQDLSPWAAVERFLQVLSQQDVEVLFARLAPDVVCAFRTALGGSHEIVGRETNRAFLRNRQSTDDADVRAHSHRGACPRRRPGAEGVSAVGAPFVGAGHATYHIGSHQPAHNRGATVSANGEVPMA